MKSLSSNQTFFFKFIYPLMWLIPTIYLIIHSIILSNNYHALLFLVIALIPTWWSTKVKKVQFDDEKIIISNYLNNQEYKFNNLKSIEFPSGDLQFHPFFKIDLTKNNKEFIRVFYMPRVKDIPNILSLFSNKKRVTRRDELLDSWKNALLLTRG